MWSRWQARYEECITYPENPKRVGKLPGCRLRALTWMMWRIHTSQKKKELPIYAYPHLTLVLTRTSSPSKVGAGAGVNLFAGGAIEVLCSSQAYRHAAYRRVRRDGALGRPACVTRGMWEMSLDYSPCSILWACLGVALTWALDLR
jgi:hypothetical protein